VTVATRRIVAKRYRPKFLVVMMQFNEGSGKQGRYFPIAYEGKDAAGALGQKELSRGEMVM
jgi:hypothetical protein